MAISDVQLALLNAGQVSLAGVATVDYANGTVTAQSAWLGSSSNTRLFKAFAFQTDPNDTNGTLIEIAQVPKNGSSPVFTEGTIVAYDANYAIVEAANTFYMISDTALSANDAALFPIADFGTTGSYTAPTSIVCFVEGTRIATARGEVAVEDLVAGDRARVLENGAETERPVVWIGHREVNLASHPDPFGAWPIRIRRDAFARGRPCRDLLVSPDHGIFVDGVLIPARLLVNNASIVREARPARVRYFHVELDRHAVLFAENLTAESYLDTGNRSWFANGGRAVDFAVRFPSDASSVARETHSRAPFVHAEDAVFPVWARLARRAAELGFVAPALETTRDPAPRVRVGGRDFRPVNGANGVYSFMLPSGSSEVRLLSRAARPCDARPWIEDRRMLGLSVSRIRHRHGRDVEDLALDGTALASGWWAVERGGDSMARWTNGDAVLRLPEAHGMSRLLELTVGGGIDYPVETPRLGATDRALARIA